uniref:Uncharacterized protein n=1 Tax=Equus asinus asinus TaxID=83772 RepID=A0A8C4PUS9_EQUAS
MCVRLCHHAQVAQQDDGRQAVGAALDQELPVRGALAAHAPQLPLTQPRPSLVPCQARPGCASCEGRPSPLLLGRPIHPPFLSPPHHPPQGCSHPVPSSLGHPQWTHRDSLDTCPPSVADEVRVPSQGPSLR